MPALGRLKQGEREGKKKGGRKEGRKGGRKKGRKEGRKGGQYQYSVVQFTVGGNSSVTSAYLLQRPQERTTEWRDTGHTMEGGGAEHLRRLHCTPNLPTP